MMKRKAFWALLAAGITVVSTGVVSAQWIDRETLTRMLSGADGSRVAKSPGSTAAAVRAGMREVSTKDSLVGSWIETATFPPEIGRPPLKALVTFHHDGTLAVYDQGNVTLDPPSVFSAGAGIWKQKGPPRTFVYTQRELISDLSGNLIGFLKVRGTYTLSASGHTYEGRSFFEVSVGGEEVSGWVTNAGERILLERPPPDPKK
jgi:hypothetical protein